MISTLNSKYTTITSRRSSKNCVKIPLPQIYEEEKKIEIDEEQDESKSAETDIAIKSETKSDLDSILSKGISKHFKLTKIDDL